MAIAQGVGIFKILGVFGMVVILLLWLGGAGIGVAKAARNGDWSIALQETGGRLFALDSSLNTETEFLLNPQNTNTYENVFHITYAFSMIFLLFIVGFMLFKFFNWLVGIKQFSPSSDIIIIILVIALLLLFQFLYTYLVLKQNIIPLTGLWNFIKNLPSILSRITI